MLSITSSPPAAWSPAPAVSSVVATTPVSPVQATARDAQTGSGLAERDSKGAGQPARRGEAPADGPGVRSEKGKSMDAAPLLPRQSPDNQASTEIQDARAEADREEQARQAEETALKQKLQDVVANIWKASAAVVDVVLGRVAAQAKTSREDAAAGAAGASGAIQRGADSAVNRAAASADPMALAAGGRSALPGSSASVAADGEALLDLPRASQEVVAYDAQGQSSLMPLEVGSLVNRRV